MHIVGILDVMKRLTEGDIHLLLKAEAEADGSLLWVQGQPDLSPRTTERLCFKIRINK